MNEYSLSNRIRILKEDDKIADFENIFNHIYDKLSKDKQEGKLAEKTLMWSVPTTILVFLENTL